MHTGIYTPKLRLWGAFLDFGCAS